MEFTAFKAAGLLGGTAAASTGAYGIYHLSFPKETIRSKLEAHFKGTNTVFLHDKHSEGSELGTWYSKVSNKPKERGVALTFSELKSGCSEKVDERFKSSDDDLYAKVKELCFLNVNTLLQEAGKSSLRSTEAASHEEWKTAWEEYQRDSGKEGKGIKITGSSKDTDLNGSSTDKNKGDPALHEGCSSTSSKKMYDAESLLPPFRAGCVK